MNFVYIFGVKSDTIYIQQKLGFNILSEPVHKLNAPENKIVIEKVTFVNYKGNLISYGTFFYEGFKYLLFNNCFYQINWEKC